MELGWNFFLGLETPIYKEFLDQKIKSSTVPSLFFPPNKKKYFGLESSYSRDLIYIKIMIGLVFSMMTERDFWDMFHSKHNPKYHAKKKKQIKTNKYIRQTKVDKTKRKIPL